MKLKELRNIHAIISSKYPDRGMYRIVFHSNTERQEYVYEKSEGRLIPRGEWDHLFFSGKLGLAYR